jgi:hypothetical protein
VIPVAPEFPHVLADFFAKTIPFFTHVIAKGSHLIALLAAEFAGPFAGFACPVAGFEGTLTGLGASFAAPIPETIATAGSREHSHSQETKDQQFHEVIDEQISDLFRRFRG